MNLIVTAYFPNCSCNAAKFSSLMIAGEWEKMLIDPNKFAERKYFDSNQFGYQQIGDKIPERLEKNSARLLFL